MFSIFYQKNNNKDLFKSLEEIVNSTKNQNYIPIYKNFFNINKQNFNNINLNHKYNLSLINNKKTENIYNCSLTFGDNQTLCRDSFFKFSPLLDPLKYMTGKYKNITEDELLSLPDIEKNKCIEKVSRINNSAYIDSFFSYLSSQLLHEHGFIHGLDFYGSFICIKNQYEFDIIEDLEFLNDSTYFHKNKNIKYNITKSSNINLFSETTRNYKEKIEFLDDKLSFKIDDNSDLKFDDLFIKNSQPLTEKNLKEFNLKNNIVFQQDISNNKKSLSSTSSSTSCSSRSSKTSDESENVSLDSNYMENNSESRNSNSDYSDDSETDTTLSSNITAKAKINKTWVPGLIFPLQICFKINTNNTVC